MVRIILVDDDELVAEAFEVLLQTDPEFEVVARLSNGHAVIPALEQHHPDLMLIDVKMPGPNGIDITRAVRQHGYTGKIILLTSLACSGYLQVAIKAGANGYLLKTITAVRLIDSIHEVLQGRTVLDPDLAAEALQLGPCPLNERELDVMRQLARGVSTLEIAKLLFLSPGTVRNYISSAMTKLGTNSRISAISYCQDRGWL
ncbi:response regulator [Devriesea agamarum]|uniref:response regulator n=1 Tax=Devriesea agamarum TaxID=472569 RepID=UPI00071E185D|nr:response regulator transcription factor [Devriesea agamarum]